MENDIASLGLSIDSSDAPKASSALDGLTASAEKLSASLPNANAKMQAFIAGGGEAGEAARKAASGVDELAEKVKKVDSKNISELAKAAHEAEAALSALGPAGEVAAGVFAGIIAATSFEKIIEGLREMISRTQELNVELAHTQLETGGTYTDLIRIKDAAITSGVGFAAASQQMNTLARTLKDAVTDATGTAARAFAQLNLDPQVLSAMSLSEAYIAVAKATTEYEASGNKAQATNEVLGRSAAKASALFADLSKNQEDAASTTADQIQNSVTLDEKIGKLSLAWERLKQGLLELVSGPWSLLVSIMNLTVLVIGDVVGAFNVIFGWVSKLITKIVELTDRWREYLGVARQVVIPADLPLPPVADPTGKLGGPPKKVHDTDTQLRIDAIKAFEAAEISAIKNVAAIRAVDDAEAINQINSLKNLKVISQQEAVTRIAAINKVALQQQLDDNDKTIDAEIKAWDALEDAKAKAKTPEAVNALSKQQDELEKQINATLTARNVLLEKQKFLSTDTNNAIALINQKQQQAITAANDAFDKYLQKEDEKLDKMKFEATLIDKSKVDQAELTARYQEQLDVDTKILDLTVLIQRLKEQDPTSALIPTYQAQLALIQEMGPAWVNAAGAAARANEQAKEHVKDLQDVWKTFSDFGQQAFEGLFNKGDDTFKQLGASIKKYLLDALFALISKQWIIPIVAQITQTNAGAFQSVSNNPLSNLLGGGGTGGGGGLSSLGGLFGGGGGLSSMGNLAAEGTGAFDMAGSVGAGLGVAGDAAAAAWIPVVGWIAAAGIAIYSLIQANKKPTEVKGQLQIGGSNFEDNLSTTNQTVGAIGFNDENTQQFSGQVGQTLTKLVSGAIDAFSSRMDTEGKAKLSEVLKNTVFEAFSGTFTTEDFLQAYGGKVLQQVATAAFSVLDPALGSVEAAFTGTADEVGTFTNTLLSIYDASKGFSNEFKANIVAALSDATQETADKVLAFVTIVRAVAGTFGELSEKLDTLDPDKIVSFVDALGGGQAALASFAYLSGNFLTGAQQMANATQVLNNDFTSLGVTAIPQTHQQFLDLLNSFDLTTDAGQQAYATVLGLSQLFVAVHGTAEQAAQATQQFADALFNTAQNAQQGAQDFYNQNFYTDQQKRDKAAATGMQAIADASKTFNITIPTTVKGFQQFVDGIDQSTLAGQFFYQAMIKLAPSVYAVATAADAAADTLTNAANTISTISIESSAQKAVDKLNKQIDTILQNSTGDFGDKLGIKITLYNQQIQTTQQALNEAIATYGQFSNNALVTALQDTLKDLQAGNAQFTDELGRFTVLKAQYGADIAEQLVGLQDWYTDQQRIFKNNASVLAVLKTIFDQKWADIIAGVSTGVDNTISQLQKLKLAILDYANQLLVGDKSPLAPTEQLADALKQFTDEAALAKGGDQKALGDITQFSDRYLTLARSVFGSSSQYTDIFDMIQKTLREIATSPNGTPAGSAAPPTTVVTSDGASLPTSADEKVTQDLIQKLIDKVDASLTQTRQAIVNSNKATADSVVADADQNRKALVDALEKQKKR